MFLGTYHLKQGDESSSLILRADQTFQQDVTHAGIRQSRSGTWRRADEGEVVFSREFLPLKGQVLWVDGTTHGNPEKAFGLFPTIALAQEYVLWYSRNPSQYSSIAGTYTGEEGDVASTLVMRIDRTFEQTLTRAGTTRHAYCTWSFRETGDILFSRDFLKTSGEPVNTGEVAYATSLKGSYLEIEIAANPSTPQPVYRKKTLSY